MDIEELLRMTEERDASDLFLTAGAPPVLRIHTLLQPTELESLSPHKIRELVGQLLDENRKKRFEEEREACFMYELPGWARFRVTIFSQRGSLAAAIRRFPYKVPSIEELNLPKEVLQNFCSLRSGLILVTGSTGSGKSTTLATMINMINESFPYHIITIEDPVEYIFLHKKSIVEQRSIPEDALSFSIALRNILRQSPDVLMIGEMRDRETVSTAITAAETGVLVLSTLHTSTASETVNRIINFFPPDEQVQVRIQVASVLKGVFSQQLIPSSTRKGVVPAWEVLIGLDKVANVIREGSLHQLDNIIETSFKDGMQSMDQTLLNLFKRKLITQEELLRRIRDKNREELRELVKEDLFSSDFDSNLQEGFEPPSGMGNDTPSF